MTLGHFVFSGGRKAHAQFAKVFELCIIERMAVHDVDVVTEQACSFKLFPAIGRARGSPPLVQ